MIRSPSHPSRSVARSIGRGGVRLTAPSPARTGESTSLDAPPEDPAPDRARRPAWHYQQPPVPPRRRRPPAPAAGAPVLALAIGLVAILAGGALFMSGFLVGQRFSQQPGTPGRPGRPLPAVLGHVPDDSRPATPVATSTTSCSFAARSAGMVEALGDPYSALPDARGVPDRAPGPVGPVRGDRGRDRDEERGRRDERLLDARAGVHPHRRQPDRGLASREGRAAGGRRDPRGRRRRARRAHRRRGARQGPRQEGHRGRPHDQARGGRCVRRGDRPRRHRPAGGDRRRISPTARSATSG